MPEHRIITHPYWMQTVSGRCFDFLDPQPYQVDVDDVAHHLATAAIRYAGATVEPYSVAQHSVWVADYLRAKHAAGPHAILLNPSTGEERVIDRAPWIEMEGLVHDTPEAYTGDMTRPWKQLLLVKLASDGKGGLLPDPLLTVNQVENHYLHVIKRAIAPELLRPNGKEYEWVSTFHHQMVKEADAAALATERRDLCVKPLQPWADATQEPWGPTIVPLGWRDAKELFLTRYHELRGLLQAA